MDNEDFKKIITHDVNNKATHKDIKKAIDKYREIKELKHETRLDSQPLCVELTGDDVDTLFDILNYADSGLPDFLKPQSF